MISIHKTGLAVFGCVLAAVFAPVFGWGAVEVNPSSGLNAATPDWTDSVLKDHVDIGTRITAFSLEDSNRGDSDHFYGSIDKLDAKQNYWPLKVFVDYKINSWWGFELTWDEVRAKTITKSDGHTDGVIEAGGPIMSVFGQYPNATIFTPYAGAGFTYLLGGFDDDHSWKHPPTNPAIVDQTFSLDNTWGWVAYLGVSAQLTDHWSLDLYVRHMDAELKGSKTVVTAAETQTDNSVRFPLDNDALGLGVRYSF
jgi:outer membrane protein W